MDTETAGEFDVYDTDGLLTMARRLIPADRLRGKFSASADAWTPGACSQEDRRAMVIEDLQSVGVTMADINRARS